MAGVTATINIQTFRADWCSHLPISVLCERYTITKDQVVRLRTVWSLPLRNDRKLRAKPPRYRDPTPQEIAERSAMVRAKWDQRTEAMRRVGRSKAYTVPEIPLPPTIRIVSGP